MAKKSDGDGPKLIAYSVQNILTTRRRLLEDPDILRYIGPPMDGPDFKEFVKTLQKKLAGRPSLSVLHDSIHHLAGAKITEELLRREIWRLLGNLPRLRRGRPAPVWVRQVEDEWVPMQAIGMKHWRNRQDKVGGTFTFRILAGTPTGLTATRFLSNSFCHFLAREMGFTNTHGKFPLQNIAELVGMRMYGLVVKEMSIGRPVFTRQAVRPALNEYNRGLIRRRRRVNFKCPKGYQHECWRCPIGYDVCAVATHPSTYIRAACKVCNDKLAWFEPHMVELGLCVECKRKKDTQRKERT